MPFTFFRKWCKIIMKGEFLRPGGVHCTLPGFGFAKMCRQPVNGCVN